MHPIKNNRVKYRPLGDENMKVRDVNRANDATEPQQIRPLDVHRLRPYDALSYFPIKTLLPNIFPFMQYSLK